MESKAGSARCRVVRFLICGSILPPPTARWQTGVCRPFAPRLSSYCGENFRLAETSPPKVTLGTRFIKGSDHLDSAGLAPATRISPTGFQQGAPLPTSEKCSSPVLRWRGQPNPGHLVSSLLCPAGPSRFIRCAALCCTCASMVPRRLVG